MEIALYIVGGIIVGAAVAAVVAYRISRNSKNQAIALALNEQKVEMEKVRAEVTHKQERIDTLEREKNTAVQERQALQEQYNTLNQEATKWKTQSDNAIAQLEEDRKRYAEEKEAEKKNREQFEQKQLELLSAKFETTSQRLLKERSEALSDVNKQSMGQLLNPLREQMESVQKLMRETRSANEDSNAKLRGTIDSMVNQAQQLSQDANNLADALKNRGKVHGDWGEQVLDDILQGSGLREGEEYSRQMSFLGEDNNELRPDVVVNCADGKRIIIDSKVSIKDYTDALGAADEKERELYIKNNLESVKKHVKELAKKNYPKYVPSSMNYVLMFIPNEGAYVMAMNANPSLGQEAFREGVIIVNPTNLMMALHLVLQTWQNTRQEDNCKKILKEASALYDKVMLAAETYDRLGQQMETAITTYKKGKGQLLDGRDNVLRKIEHLRELGVTSTKRPRLRSIERDTNLSEDIPAEDQQPQANQLSFPSQEEEKDLDAPIF